MENKDKKDVGPLPERWLRCPRLSTSFIVDRFLAFKTPLSEEFSNQMDVEHWFSPKMVLDYCNTTHQKLGLWIDLTFSTRFYNSSSIVASGVKYLKLKCRGNQETPTVEQTRTFLEVVDEHIAKNPMDKVAVHCTHGFNRTGFLIVSYLVEKLDFAVDAALILFAQSRPPGIYKQSYIDELFQRYDEPSAILEAPSLPAWCFDVSSNEDTSTVRKGKRTAEALHLDGGDTDASNPKLKKRPRKTTAFMVGVPGVHPVQSEELASELRAEVARACKWKKTDFPGSQPVSMDQKNLQLLSEKPYRVSWKADGTRYMLYIRKKSEVYFIDRTFNSFQVHNVTFLRRHQAEHLENTLVDGEMVIDEYKGNQIPRYLIYDIVQLESQSIMDYKFPDRLRTITKEIIEPRVNGFGQGKIDRHSEPFGVRLKDFYEIPMAEKLLGPTFAQQLPHPPDGLIFQPADDPYLPGVCDSVLKWKPFELNSIDFRLRIGMESGEGILSKKIAYLYVGQYDKPFAKLPKCTKDIVALDNKIIECSLSEEKNEWIILRERTDKLHPNSYNTAISVFKSIRHPVTKDALLRYIKDFGYHLRCLYQEHK